MTSAVRTEAAILTAQPDLTFKRGFQVGYVRDALQSALRAFDRGDTTAAEADIYRALEVLS